MAGRQPKGVTRGKILQAARKLFVENGYAGTSMGMIRKEAEVNHSLLFHYFDNKANLWAAVKSDIMDSAQEDEISLPSLNLPFKDFLKELTRRQIEFYRHQPDLVRLLSWQRLERNEETGDENEFIGISKSQMSLDWIDAYKHYQSKGEVNAKLRPEFIMSFHLAICMSAAMDPNVFIEQKKDFEEYIDFSLKSMLKAFA